MSDKTQYVSYYVAQQQRGGARISINGEGRDLGTLGHIQNQAIIDFIQERNPQAEIIGAYVETPDSRRSSKWPQLNKALELCKRQSATLLIAELGTLTSNESFTQLLLASGVKFHCLDQPFVNQTILEALSKHAEVQRKLHGKLIREGLKMTSAKSGNPNAAEVISKVNKPKSIFYMRVVQRILSEKTKKGNVRIDLKSDSD